MDWIIANLEKINAETITAICALFVSLLATVLAAWLAYEQRRHMRLSLRPILNLRSLADEKKIEIALENRGTGPMLIKKVSVIKQGKSFEDEQDVKDNIGEHLSSLLHRLKNVRFFYTYFDNPAKLAVRPGQEIMLFELDATQVDGADPVDLQEIGECLCRLVVKVSYDDIYNDHIEDREHRLEEYFRTYSVKKNL